MVSVCRLESGGAAGWAAPWTAILVTPASERPIPAGSGRLASYDAATVVRPLRAVREVAVRTSIPGRLRGVAPAAKVTVSGTRPARAATSNTEASRRLRTDGASFGTTQVWVPALTCSTGLP